VPFVVFKSKEMASSGGQRKEKVSAFKIHVKNLPEGTTSDELQAIFQEFGKVVEAVIAQKKKFGFVVSLYIASSEII